MMTYDNKLYLPFDGSLVDQSAHGLSPSVATGGLIYSTERALFGQSVQVAEATENLCTNPSIETGTAGHTALGSAISQSSDWAKFGSYSLKVVLGTGAYNGEQYVVSGVTPLADYISSVFVYATGAAVGRPVTLEWRDDDTGTWIHGKAFTLVEGENFLSHTWTVPAGTTNLRVRVLKQNDATDYTVYLDGFQTEAKAYPTPTAIGNMGAGHTWTGTPHASTSVRVATIDQYGISLPSKYTIIIRFVPFSIPSEVVGVYPTPFIWSDASGRNALAIHYSPGSMLYLIQKSAGVSQGALNDIDLVRFQGYDYVVSFNGTTLSLYRDGSLVGTQTPSPMDGTPDTLYVGVHNNGAYQLNGWLDVLAVLDYDIGPAAVAQLHDNYLAGIPFQFANGLYSPAWSARQPAVALASRQPSVVFS